MRDNQHERYLCGTGPGRPPVTGVAVLEDVDGPDDVLVTVVTGAVGKGRMTGVEVGSIHVRVGGDTDDDDDDDDEEARAAVAVAHEKGAEAERERMRR